MSRNVTILVIVLVILLIAGYLVWIRQKFQAPEAQIVVTPTPEIVSTPTAVPTIASPSATASPSGRPTVSRTRPTATPRAATSSGRIVR